MLQGAALDFKVVRGRQFLRHDQVVAGLRFVGIGDGGRADFEIALGLFELLGNRGFLRCRQLHAVLCNQDVEIGLRAAQDQILLGDFILRFADGHLQFGLVVQRPVLFAEQRLDQAHTVAVAVVLHVAAKGREERTWAHRWW